MIVVVGRPGLTSDGRLDRPVGHIAVAAAEAGGRVELVGTVGDDADGDAVVVELGRAGIGHAAVLRDPAAETPRDDASGATALPRLDPADIELGLRYLAECQVLIVAELLPAEAMHVAVDAATYHRAALIVLTDPGVDAVPAIVPGEATVLETPAESAGAFAALVGRYAALLDDGRGPADAWRAAIDDTGWEQGSA